MFGGGYFTAPHLARWLGLLVAEAVEGAALELEGGDHVHGGDGLPLGVLGVGDGVPDHVLQEDLEHAAGQAQAGESGPIRPLVNRFRVLHRAPCA
jgi:hypothetical protein